MINSFLCVLCVCLCECVYMTYIYILLYTPYMFLFGYFMAQYRLLRLCIVKLILSRIYVTVDGVWLCI
jgi:hypothetical protein